MFETPLTVVGRIITDPRRRRVADQEVISFRVASNSRRRDADGNWEPGNTLYITVNCWGKLVTGVGAALGKGAAVIAVGHVYTSEYEDRDGLRRSSLEMRATSVGPDLSKAIVQILESVSNASKDAEPAPAPEDHQSADEPAPPSAADELTLPAKADELTPPAEVDEPEPAKAEPTPAKAGEGKGRKALPLSA
jgi:single-strand DNA-binding protein